MKRKIIYILVIALLFTLFTPFLGSTEATLSVSYGQVQLLDSTGNEITEYSLSEQENFTVRVPVISTQSSEQSVLVLAALFKTDNSLKWVKNSETIINKDYTSAELEINLNEPVAVGEKLKIMVWTKDQSPVLLTPLEVVCQEPAAAQRSLRIMAVDFAEKDERVTVSSNGTLGSFGYTKWAAYDVDFGNGFSRFIMHIGTSQAKTPIEIYIDCDGSDYASLRKTGTKIGTIQVEPTDGFSDLKEQYAEISTVTGKHRVYLVVTNGAGDFDWIQFDNEPLPPELTPGDEAELPVYINDSDSAIAYTGMLSEVSDIHMDNDIHAAQKDGSFFEYAFTGTGIDVISDLCPQGGQIKVLVDGVLQEEVSCFSTEVQAGRTVFTKTGLIDGQHVIKVIKAGGEKMVLDALKVYSRPIRIACIGDSITYRGTASMAYPTYLADELGSVGGYEVGNFGSPGLTLLKDTSNSYWVHENFAKSAEFLPDIVIIMLGTNDVKKNNWVNKGSFVSTYKEMIEYYKGLSSRPRVYLNTSPTTFAEGSLGKEYSDDIISGELLEFMTQISKETDCPLIDVNLATKNAFPFFAGDGVHPNDAGAKLIAKKVASCIPCPKQRDKASIAALKDDKSSAYTFISDDGYWNSVNYFDEEFEKYGLKGSVALIVDYAKDYEAETENGLYGTWDQWQSLIEKGRFDIINHSMTHPDLRNIDSDALEMEVNGAREELMKRFPGQKVLGFCLPGNNTNDDVTSKIKEQHYGLRLGGGYNSLDPSENDWYYNRFQTVSENLTAEDMNAWIDTAVQNGQWLIEMWHGVEERWSPPTKATTDAHLQYASTKLDTLWSATYNEAIAYMRERQTATLKILSENAQEMQLLLTDEMDDTLFDYPLTLKVSVPYNWDTVTILQNGQQIIGQVITNAGQKTVRFDAVPDKGLITIKQ